MLLQNKTAIVPSVIKTDMFNQMDEKERVKMIESSAFKLSGAPKEPTNVALFIDHPIIKLQRISIKYR